MRMIIQLLFHQKESGLQRMVHLNFRLFIFVNPAPHHYASSVASHSVCFLFILQHVVTLMERYGNAKIWNAPQRIWFLSKL